VITNKLQSNDIDVIEDNEYEVDIDGEILMQQELALRLNNNDKIKLFKESNVFNWVKEFYIGLENKFNLSIIIENDLCNISFNYEIEEDYMALCKE